MQMFGLTIFFVITYFVLFFRENRQGLSPFEKVVFRWLTCSLNTYFLAYLFKTLTESDRPFWLLWVTFLVSWITCDSIILWVFINKYSSMNMPFTGKYSPVFGNTPYIWPLRAKYIEWKNWLEKEGFVFKKLLWFKDPYEEKTLSLLYLNEDNTCLLQILWFVSKKNQLAPLCFVYSRGENGKQYITSNSPLPFVDFLPKDWEVASRPLVQTPSALYFLHKKIERNTLMKWDEVELSSFLNQNQALIESSGVENGFMHQLKDREQYGLLTKEGCYSLWKTTLSLKYFAIS